GCPRADQSGRADRLARGARLFLEREDSSGYFSEFTSLLRRQRSLADEGKDLARCGRDVGAGPVDGADAGALQLVVVLGRDDAAPDDQNIAAVLIAQGLDEGRDERLVAGGLARDADDMDVVLDRLARALFRGLEERADIDVEADIRKGGGDH